MSYIKFAALLFLFSVLYSNNIKAEIFGSSENKINHEKGFPKWAEMMERFQHEEAICNNNNNCILERIIQTLKDDTKDDDDLKKLDKVNRFVNSVQYINDTTQWNEKDYWATPIQFFERGGDCEDYAIAKFILLKKLGFDSENMRIVILNDNFSKMIHSVLVVFVDDNHYVLDNGMKRVFKTADIRHYKPIFSINDNNWWYHRAKNESI